MNSQYVDIPPELMGKADPDQQWIEKELDRIDPWRSEQGHDGADTAALRKLVLELRNQLATPQPETGGPAFPAMEVRTADTGDLVANASQGITVRDYFAAKAMQGFMAQGAFTDSSFHGEAAGAYRVADAMLEARAA